MPSCVVLLTLGLFGSAEAPAGGATDWQPVEMVADPLPGEAGTDRPDSAAAKGDTQGPGSAAEPPPKAAKAEPAPARPANPNDAQVIPEARKAVQDALGELHPLHLPLRMLDVALGPVREANLLLPKKWDPFGEPLETPLDRLIPETGSGSESFSPAKQAQLLGTRIASRTDVADEKAEWRWRAEAGGSFRQGSTSNTNIRSLFAAERHSRNSDVLGKLGVNYNRNGDAEPNRRAFGEFLMDRNLRGHWICYGKEEAEYDQARLIDLRSVLSAGLGFRFIDELDERLVARSGPTVSYILYAPDARNDDEARSGWLIEGEYRRLLGESVRLEWTTTALPDFDSEQQFRIRNEGALRFPVGGKQSPWHWTIGVKHEYQVNPVDRVNTSDMEGYFAITYSK